MVQLMGTGDGKIVFGKLFAKLFFWLRDDVLGDRTHPDHTRYVDFLNALMMVAIMKMMMAMMTVCGINPKHHHHRRAPFLFIPYALKLCILMDHDGRCH